MLAAGSAVPATGLAPKRPSAAPEHSSTLVPLKKKPKSQPEQGPKVKAPAAIVIEAASGTVLWSRRVYMRRPIASTTKIMTGILALRRLQPNAVVTVDRAATRVDPYREGLRPGERVRAWKLLYGLMLVSGNDTAAALAVAVGGSRSNFVKIMNLKAEALGLRHTHFRSPSGLLDEDNYSTVSDLATLARYAMRDARFRSIVRTKKKLVRWPAPVNSKLYENHNKLLWRYPGADGIKTGWTTKAGHCLVASARRQGRRLITVVLDSPDLYGDTIKLLDYGFNTAA
jgi:D-alanyl-D-alanine carboxypeptidase (penicillin-binding protein 5/6)